MLCLGDSLDWGRLVDRVGPNWPLLLSQVLMFTYVYPGLQDATSRRGCRNTLMGLARESSAQTRKMSTSRAAR